jgi:hypothetical protein
VNRYGKEEERRGKEGRNSNSTNSIKTFLSFFALSFLFNLSLVFCIKKEKKRNSKLYHLAQIKTKNY